MTTIDDTTFDAMLRAALQEAPSREHLALRGNPERRRGGRRSGFLVLTAGIAVSAWIWWSGQQEATGIGGTYYDATAQDPQSREVSESLDSQRLDELLDQLASESTRDAAAKALVAAGRPAAVRLAERLRTVATHNDGPHRGRIANAAFDGLLFAARGFGPESKAFVPPLTQRLDDVDTRQVIEVCEVFARAALWAEIPEVDGEMGASFLRLFGRRYPDPGVEAAGRCIMVAVRIRAHGQVRAAAERGSLAEALRAPQDKRRSSGFVRLGAAKRMSYEPRLTEANLAALEDALATDHPRVDEIGFVQLRTIDLTEEIHAEAATALLARASEDPHSILAHAYRHRRGATAMERRHSAVALARLLGEPGHRTERRVDAAVESLRTSLGSARAAGHGIDGSTAAVAGDAITALGQLGHSARPALPELEDLAGGSHRGLATLARRAIKKIR